MLLYKTVIPSYKDDIGMSRMQTNTQKATYERTEHASMVISYKIE